MKEVEWDSIPVYHRDSEVAVLVAVFDDIDVSKSLQEFSIEDKDKRR